MKVEEFRMVRKKDTERKHRGPKGLAWMKIYRPTVLSRAPGDRLPQRGVKLNTI